jgi:hypothetical protein
MLEFSQQFSAASINEAESGQIQAANTAAPPNFSAQLFCPRLGQLTFEQKNIGVTDARTRHSEHRDVN